LINALAAPRSFVYQGQPSRVVFGYGSLDRLADELAALGSRRALVLCTPEQLAQAEEIAGRLGDSLAGIYPHAVMHVPIEVARHARVRAEELSVDAYVAVGGGSTIGLAKAIALESTMPIVAIPTTYAGSEMTPIYGITEGGVKKTGRNSRVLPRVVIYDPTLTLTLPAAIAGPSGMNAIAHALEALYAEDANPIISLMAEEAIRALARALPRVVEEPMDLEARALCVYGAWLAGACLGSVGMGIHHKLCHTLGGAFNLPHAETHAVILPHAAAFNASAAPRAFARAAAALGAESVPERLYDLALAVGAPTSLASIGMPENGLERAAELATANPYYNPRPIERTALLALLQNAYSGQRPANG
jgi:maleylacetate reductase